MESRIPIFPAYLSRQRPDFTCSQFSDQSHPGYVGVLECKDKLKILKLDLVWQGNDPKKACTNGYKLPQYNTRCYTIAPGASHPGVIMMTPGTYGLYIDLL